MFARTMCTKPLSRVESLQADWVPQNQGLNVRVSKAMYLALQAAAEAENEPKSTVIRRWMRNGALAESFDVSLW